MHELLLHYTRFCATSTVYRAVYRAVSGLPHNAASICLVYYSFTLHEKTIHLEVVLEVIIRNVKMRDCIMQKTHKSCLQRDASACISCYPCGISMNYIELKVISCRIEWSLLQI